MPVALSAKPTLKKVRTSKRMARIVYDIYVGQLQSSQVKRPGWGTSGDQSWPAAGKSAGASLRCPQWLGIWTGMIGTGDWTGLCSS